MLLFGVVPFKEEASMAKPLISDDLWEVIEPLLPVMKRKTKRGRPRIGNREALTGILFVLKTGIPWEYLPQELGCGCGMTCWRRLHAWHEAGVWERLHHVLLESLHVADQIDWSRAVIDSSSVRALAGGPKRANARRTAVAWGRSIMC